MRSTWKEDDGTLASVPEGCRRRGGYARGEDAATPREGAWGTIGMTVGTGRSSTGNGSDW